MIGLVATLRDDAFEPVFARDPEELGAISVHLLGEPDRTGADGDDRLEQAGGPPTAAGHASRDRRDREKMEGKEDDLGGIMQAWLLPDRALQQAEI